MRTTPSILLLFLLTACGGSEPAAQVDGAADKGAANPCAASEPAAEPAAKAETPVDMTVEQLAGARSAYPLVLDVRTVEEYRLGHVPGAMLLPIDELEGSLAKLEPYKDKQIAVICQSGGRSARATKLLRKNGFDQAQNVLGGTLAWQEAGKPVVKEPLPGTEGGK